VFPTQRVIAEGGRTVSGTKPAKQCRFREYRGKGKGKKRLRKAGGLRAQRRFFTKKKKRPAGRWAFSLAKRKKRVGEENHPLFIEKGGRESVLAQEKGGRGEENPLLSPGHRSEGPDKKEGACPKK